MPQTLREPWLLFLGPGLPISKEWGQCRWVNVGPRLPQGGQGSRGGSPSLSTAFLSSVQLDAWRVPMAGRPFRSPLTSEREQPQAQGRGQAAGLTSWFVFPVLIFRAIFY